MILLKRFIRKVSDILSFDSCDDFLPLLCAGFPFLPLLCAGFPFREILIAFLCACENGGFFYLLMKEDFLPLELD